MHDGVLEQRTRLPLARWLALDEFLARIFDFGKADQMQQFGIKGAVEAVAVVGEGQFEQMRRRQQLEQRDQLAVVGAVIVPQRLVVVA